MTKALALTQRAYAEARRRQTEALSSAIVVGCAAALILAGTPLPL
jgi:3-polyprenyl-4-hydroxybenzoate decarboxylase